MKRKTFDWCMKLFLASVFVTVAFNETAFAEKLENIGAMEIVSTTSGKVSGEVTLHDDSIVRTYRGIPYAKPPVGDLRWKAPQPMDPWSGVLACRHWAPMAPQPDSGDSAERGGIDEDCLHLNLITPAKKPGEKLPVMVFFHGGGLMTHTGNSTVYCNTALPAKGVIVVTVNSRLGALGYMAHPALTKESEHQASGNYGTQDLVASLRWVKANISAFGGDPNNVTIFGESGGGSKVTSLIASPLAAGLFNRAIIESGSRSAMPDGNIALADAEKLGEKITEKLGIDNNAKDVAAQLRAKSWEEIIKASAEIRELNNLVIEGWALTDSVSNVFKSGKQNNVSVIVGSNQGEAALKTSDPNFLDLMGSVSSKAYGYCFSQLPASWRNQTCVAFHGLELPYVFGAIPDGLSTRIVLLFAARTGCGKEIPETDDKDELASENMMRLWAQFAKTGNPSVPGLVDWPAYTEASPQCLDISYELKVKPDIKETFVAPAKSPGF